uniref:Putative EG45-like domain containing protein n=1 Tax=Davidia involucrata TaxID=16924 RepID=A0A5B7BI84_DAVIN
MGAGMRVLMMVGLVICLTTAAYAAQGTATYYTPPYVPSSCYGYQNNGVMIAAASDAIWNNRAACGRNYRVRCTGPTNQGVPQPCRGQSIVVKIVDYCPPGCQGTIDLSQEAFAMIADPNAGKIKIEYTQV